MSAGDIGEALAEICEEAAALILPLWKSELQVFAKADESPLADPERLAVTWRAYKKLYGEDSSQQ